MSTVTEYYCSECGAKVTSEGTEASDHMRDAHGIDPDSPPSQRTGREPVLVPVESNPTLDESGVPDRSINPGRSKSYWDEGDPEADLPVDRGDSHRPPSPSHDKKDVVDPDADVEAGEESET